MGHAARRGGARSTNRFAKSGERFMSKLLRIVVFAALAAALPAALLAVNVDLTVSGVSGSPTNITLGTGNVTYTTSIFNASASAGTSPVLTMTIPASSTYVS